MPHEVHAEMVANVWKVVVAAGRPGGRRRHAGHPGVHEDGDPGAGRGPGDGGRRSRVDEGDVVQEGDVLVGPGRC